MGSNVSFVLLTAAQLAEMTMVMQLLRKRAAGYHRLRIAHEQLRAAHATALHKAEGDARYINELYQRLQELGRRNTALAAEVESQELVEKQLVAADLRIKELEALLTLKGLPADSLDTVLQMAKAA